MVPSESPAGPRWLGTAALPLPCSAGPACVSCCRPRSPNRTGCRSIRPSLGTPWPVRPGGAVWCWWLGGWRGCDKPRAGLGTGGGKLDGPGWGRGGGEQSPSSTARTLEGSRQHKANLVPAGGSESILLQQRWRGPVISDTPAADGFGGCVAPLVSISSVLTPGWLRRTPHRSGRKEAAAQMPGAAGWRQRRGGAAGATGGRSVAPFGLFWMQLMVVCVAMDGFVGLCHGWVERLQLSAGRCARAG